MAELVGYQHLGERLQHLLLQPFDLILNFIGFVGQCIDQQREDGIVFHPLQLFALVALSPDRDHFAEQLFGTLPCCK